MNVKDWIQDSKTADRLGIIQEYWKKHGKPPKFDCGGSLVDLADDDCAIILEIEASDELSVLFVLDDDYQIPGVQMTSYIVMNGSSIGIKFIKEESTDIEQCFDAYAYVWNKSWDIKEYGGLGFSVHGINRVKRIY